MKYPVGWIIIFAVFLFAGCAATTLPPQEVIIKVQAVEPANISVEEPQDTIQKTMTVANNEGSLSGFSFILKDQAFFKLFSALTVSDVTNLWGDLCFLQYNSKIRKLHIFINSPGGDAYTGLALADHIEHGKKNGFEIIGHASGIVASAALPTFIACSERIASPGTIFMVHETALWKWPGRETHSDIISQGKLLDLLRDRYITKLTQYSTLTKEQWLNMEAKTTWFSAQEAQEWGLVDKIE